MRAKPIKRAAAMTEIESKSPGTWRFVCAAQTSSPFFPTLFCGGEGGRRPDEGVVHDGLLRAIATSASTHRASRLSIEPRAGKPPSSAFGAFSPRKKRGGRRRSIGEHGERFQNERTKGALTSRPRDFTAPEPRL